MAVVYGLLAFNAWGQVLFSDDPPMLVALQVAIGAAGAITACGSWIGARWAPGAALAYGGATAAMLVALPTILQLEPEARPGLWIGAAAVLCFGAATAWYLRRITRRDTTAPHATTGA